VKERPTSGEYADVYVDGEKELVVGPHLVFAFRSFLMKAECGEAGLNSLILRQQQTKTSRAHMPPVRRIMAYRLFVQVRLAPLKCLPQ
jgi:hypothetical protein